jgi:heme-degrading monooxygenase HmoA
MEPSEQSRVVVVFRSRLRDDVDLAALEAAAARMVELASTMPGFVSYKNFMAEDGEAVSIVEFRHMESLLAWRDHPEHRAMQQRGREEFMSEYHIQVCRPERDYAFHKDA